MDSSIVSFNNESAFETTLKADRGDHNKVNVHELALHAMRDRCLLLQRRINALENDNMRLKLDITKNETSGYGPLQDEEKNVLQQKIAELTKQKSQLMHHVFMVSCENKNLWTKLSSLKPPDKIKDKRPLLRTDTYTNSTPKTSSNYQEKFSESSLEEISLKLINSYIEEKSKLVDQYEQMAQLQDDDDDVLNLDSIGFTYMEDPATDSLKEIRTQTEKLQLLKQELSQQEEQLKVIIKIVEAFVDGYKCPSCIEFNKNTQKEVEGRKNSISNWENPADNNTSNYTNNEHSNTAFKDVENESMEDEHKEPYDKICPMCGHTFTKDVAFVDFQSHVESHFTGEPEIDSLTDNYENVPSSFDNVI